MIRKNCQIFGAMLCFTLAACSSNPYPLLESATLYQPVTTTPENYRYLIGPGDSLSIFVWRNPEVTTTVTVRPDGFITTPLVEDVPVSGKTPTEVARLLEKRLSSFIRDPLVTVMTQDHLGPFKEQVRIIGEAEKPEFLPYVEDMTLLDVMISVDGLTDFADGNRASIVRVIDGEQRQYGVRLDDLIKDGDISANVDILPGDILIIPETFF
ncbi:XrtA/PEP-CTERM system exopolysaccharide export protein [Aestuariirhabdus litorea]|uniref:Sugar ABC transporter substrate-binding protein n=1 Tax=Aestuariirhabdus litorea TaxID=2528527 RepID=A0A3P3VPA1_9GAMM|nr:XrtA/PEP-CTERM system exopolysaccharide export protein [Aestuariirhabdus litorea]RRJ84582.1 sugar ABC transporter substrate-binding protein [Aestuariirhabdus litorea]RWW97808.1 sugar ABC transporter substrate-binding protein [Endozoicomonadaceae bacterium GTF-13]